MAGPCIDSFERRILSRPFPVEWAGWESTTTRLQYGGWQIATQQNYVDQTYRFVLRHAQLDLVGYVDWTYISPSVMSLWGDNKDLPIIHVANVARNMFTHAPLVVGDSPLTPWYRIDAQPQLCTEPLKSLADLSVFAKLQPKEILIPRADMSVVEHLEAIIKAQEPKQHELRQSILSQSRNVRQIASIAEVA